MVRERVESSSVRSVGYGRDAGILEVEFASGGVYQYMDVPEAEYLALLAAPSKGKHVNGNVKTRYSFRRVLS